MSEYTEQALAFLDGADAAISIDFVGLAVNRDWKEKDRRNLYNVTLTTPKGTMNFDFWDSLYDTEVTLQTLDEYVKKSFGRRLEDLSNSEKNRAKKELARKKEAAKPTAYDVLACLTKYDPGTFEDFCAEFGYDEDSRSAERIYFAVQKEYSQLSQIFTPEQMDAMREIN